MTQEQVLNGPTFKLFKSITSALNELEELTNRLPIHHPSSLSVGAVRKALETALTETASISRTLGQEMRRPLP